METKDLADKLSLRDILSYFLPGLFGTLGIFILIATTPLNSIFLNINIGVSKIPMVLFLSYPAGVIFSSFSVSFSNYLLKKRRLKDPRKELPYEFVNMGFIDAFP